MDISSLHLIKAHETDNSLNIERQFIGWVVKRTVNVHFLICFKEEIFIKNTGDSVKRSNSLEGIVKMGRA